MNFHCASFIETKCWMGSGRQALRILDRSMTVSAERLALTSLQELGALKCSKMEHLEATLNKFEQLRGRCGSLDPLHSFEYLRKIVKPISQCHFVLNQVQHAPPSSEKAETLLADLRRVIAEWKFERSFHGKGDGGAGSSDVAMLDATVS